MFDWRDYLGSRYRTGGCILGVDIGLEGVFWETIKGLREY